MAIRLTLSKNLSFAAINLLTMAAVLLAVLMNVSASRAQSTGRQAATNSVVPLAFDVASVKPTNPESRGLMLIRPMPGGQTYIARNVPLRMMIEAMYRITDSQIAGGPDWTTFPLTSST